MLPAATISFTGPRCLLLAFSLTPEPTKRAAKRGARKHLKRPTRCAAEKGKAHVNQNAQTYPTTITITKYTTQHNYEYYELKYYAPTSARSRPRATKRGGGDAKLPGTGSPRKILALAL